MTKTYKKPVVSIDTGMAEGVYAASGQGTLNVTYHGVWDRWGTNGGKGLAMADWSGINGTITLNITFNDTVDQAETDDASVQTSWSGKTATFIFASTATNPVAVPNAPNTAAITNGPAKRMPRAINRYFHHFPSSGLAPWLLSA